MSIVYKVYVNETRFVAVISYTACALLRKDEGSFMLAKTVCRREGGVKQARKDQSRPGNVTRNELLKWMSDEMNVRCMVCMV